MSIDEVVRLLEEVGDDAVVNGVIHGLKHELKKKEIKKNDTEVAKVRHIIDGRGGLGPITDGDRRTFKELESYFAKRFAKEGTDYLTFEDVDPPTDTEWEDREGQVWTWETSAMSPTPYGGWTLKYGRRDRHFGRLNTNDRSLFPMKRVK